MQNISKDMEKFLNASRVGSGLTHYLQAEGFLPATAPKRTAGLPASKPQGRPAAQHQLGWETRRRKSWKLSEDYF